MSLYLAPASVASEANRLGARNGLPARQRNSNSSQRFDREDARGSTAHCPINWTCPFDFPKRNMSKICYYIWRWRWLLSMFVLRVIVANWQSLRITFMARMAKSVEICVERIDVSTDDPPMSVTTNAYYKMQGAEMGEFLDQMKQCTDGIWNNNDAVLCRLRIYLYDSDGRCYGAIAVLSSRGAKRHLDSLEVIAAKGSRLSGITPTLPESAWTIKRRFRQ